MKTLKARQGRLGAAFSGAIAFLAWPAFAHPDPDSAHVHLEAAAWGWADLWLPAAALVALAAVLHARRRAGR